MDLEIHKNISSISVEELIKIFNLDIDGTFNYFDDPFTFNIGVVKNGDQILGAGIIRVVNELKMILDQDLPRITKAKVLQGLMDEAIKLRQCKELLVTLTFPQDFKKLMKYSNLLKDHYNFYEDNSILMRKEF